MYIFIIITRPLFISKSNSVNSHIFCIFSCKILYQICVITHQRPYTCVMSISPYRLLLTKKCKRGDVAMLVQLIGQLPKTQLWHAQIQPECRTLCNLCMSQSVTGWSWIGILKLLSALYKQLTHTHFTIHFIIAIHTATSRDHNNMPGYSHCN